MEQEVTDLHPREFADTLQRLEILELIEGADTGYAFVYSITN